MALAKKIAIVGGGFSGFGCIKSLKEEGLTPVCYEKTANPGGTWFYREEPVDGLPSIMPTTVINHSKEMGAISNFVPDEQLPNYMGHKDVYRYFMAACEKYDTLKHVICNREVVRVARAEDYEETGRWCLTVKNTENGSVTNEIFDGVMLAVGHITFPYTPSYPGLDRFQGTVMHTHSLKKVDGFANKNVVIIGIGCSALDAAVEISNVAKKVYLSTRRGSWIIPRVGPIGLPFDYVMLRRYVTIIQGVMGYEYASRYLEKNFLEKKFNHTLYNLRPSHHVLSKDPAVNDGLPMKLITGSVVVKGDVERFTERGVLFAGEETTTNVDAVVMATGYQWQFPFLEDDVLTTEADNRINLYKCVYPPHLRHSTLAFIGFILPFGPGFPLGEMQCRWAARVFAGRCALPDEATMRADIARRHETNSRRYTPSNKMTVRVEYISYLDEIAELIGAKPNLLKLLFTDPKLFRTLVFGPSLPYQYRLQGPHRWEGAREAILTAHERVRAPISGPRHLRKTRQRTFGAALYVKYFVLLLLTAFWLSQGTVSAKYYATALLLPYFLTWKSFNLKYFMCLLMLPFFVPWNGFVSSYFLTLLVPYVLAMI